MKNLFYLSILIYLISCNANNPPKKLHLTPIESEVNFGHRGSYITENNEIWLSGENGSFVFSLDSGKTFTEDTLPGGKKLDFRDLYIKKNRDIFMISAGENHGVILKSSNHGKSWQFVHLDTTKGVFFNGIDFFDENDGIAYGDQINGEIDLLFTTDGGQNWTRKEVDLPNALEGEAGFAASGTGIVISDNETAYIGQGNAKSTRVLKTIDKGKSWTYLNTPMISGEGYGIYAMDFYDNNLGVIVGGHWEKVSDTLSNCFITKDGGLTWIKPKRSPYGYRSGVQFIDSNTIICSGRNGVDISYDQGITWENISTEGYYSIASRNGITILSGAKGKLAILN